MSELVEELKRIIENEGDSLDWVDPTTGYECAIRRVDKFGHLCGYVRVPETHPYFNKKIMNTELDVFEVHWGLTFDGKMDFIDVNGNTDPNNKEGHWIGFDCGHAGDLLPRLFIDRGFISAGETYKTKNYVIIECGNLAKQLKELDDGSGALDLIESNNLD